jgi:hypothetical protein
LSLGKDDAPLDRSYRAPLVTHANYGHDHNLHDKKDAIRGIKSEAMRLDGVSIKFLRLILPSILPCMTHMFNTVLTCTIFPEGRNWHIILVRVMSSVFVGMSTYWATLLIYWVFHWIGITASGYAVRCTGYCLLESNLYWELQFDRSARLSNLIVGQHYYATTASSFFVRGAVSWNCSPTSVKDESSEARFKIR